MKKKIKVLLLLCALALGVAAAIGTTTAMAESTGIIEVSAMEPATAEPVLLTTFCFVPSRSTLAAYRADCDEYSEKAGFAHGVLRPKNDHDGPLSGDCPAVPHGEPVPEVYVCLGVGQP